MVEEPIVISPNDQMEEGRWKTSVPGYCCVQHDCPMGGTKRSTEREGRVFNGGGTLMKGLDHLTGRRGRT